ncbi:hypothetical protein CEXT_15611 [Caerostris extrusa]|uniref:Uncharacterized protein n=1 Tax=Caerostris extrusa TaxID=172846 RepID=A0AAV4MBL3_CAEEX|nr:hypothetical protein CEXT_15611 [Caerostris extrusa]
MKPRAAENRDFSFNSFLKTSWLQTNEWEEDASDFSAPVVDWGVLRPPWAVVCFRPGEAFSTPPVHPLQHLVSVMNSSHSVLNGTNAFLNRRRLRGCAVCVARQLPLKTRESSAIPVGCRRCPCSERFQRIRIEQGVGRVE